MERYYLCLRCAAVMSRTGPLSVDPPVCRCGASDWEVYDEPCDAEEAADALAAAIVEP